MIDAFVKVMSHFCLFAVSVPIEKFTILTQHNEMLNPNKRFLTAKHSVLSMERYTQIKDLRFFFFFISIAKSSLYPNSKFAIKLRIVSQ